MNIIISGLTAAGKTTHCNLLAHKFQLEIVSASTLLARKGGIPISVDPTDSKFWISGEGAALDAWRKENKQIDLAVDAELKKLSKRKHRAVFDAWGLPWISSAPAFRIWLGSSLESRLLKALVSHRWTPGMTDRALRNVLKRKDKRAREYFLAHYSFDLFHDREGFDLILDISAFIRKPHILSAKRSIRLADEILSSAVGWYLEKDETHRLNFTRCFDRHGPGVFVGYPTDLLA